MGARTACASPVTGAASRFRDPRDVAAQVVEALLKGESEVLADEVTRHFKAALSGPVEGLAVA
ncbi:hypothetical protein ACWDU0_12085 [Streptomyces cellulosae]